MRVLLLLASLVIIVVIGTTGYFLVRGVATPEIAVPDVLGRSYEEAATLLKERGLLVDIVPVFGPDTAANTVIRLSPPAGSIVKPGRLVLVTVVSGEALLAVPHLVGTYFVEAENRLRRAGMEKGVEGLRLGQITSVLSDSPPGLILAQTPAPGVEARSGTPVDVDIAVDRGGETMPNLVGKMIGEAMEILGARGYAFQSIEPYVVASTPPDVVMSQSPASGSRLTPTTVIRAIIAKAPPIAVSPTAYPSSTEAPPPVTDGLSPASNPDAGGEEDPRAADPFRPIQQP